MKNAWLVRPFPHGKPRITEFKKDDIVAIGWPGIGDLTGRSREAIKLLLQGKPYELSGLALGNAYATIDIFVNRMKSGDIVLVPNGEDIFFAEICSDYYLDARFDDDKTGFSHQRRVKWLKSTAREDLSKPLRSSLKVHRTTADLSRHYKEIEALSKGEDYTEEDSERQTITVSYPLRRDFMITFDIPADISRDEAKRLSQHIETLYYAE